MKNLKKTKTECYSLAREVLNYPDMPKMKECSYECLSYMHWLSFVVSGSGVDSYILVTFTYDSPSKLIRVREYDFDTNEILSDNVYDYDSYKKKLNNVDI